MYTSCVICGHSINYQNQNEFGSVRGNSERYVDRTFRLWKCPICDTLMAVDPCDLSDIYSPYALDQRTLNGFARSSFANLLSRLKAAGLRPHHTILDYGCGNGVFISFMRQRGYSNIVGYDPYRPEYTQLSPHVQFDLVIANDTIEHAENPRAFLKECARHVAPNGILYIGTTDSEDVEISDLERHRMRLHQPYHRLLFTQKTLHKLVGELPDMTLVSSYRRSYLDTLTPFVNYRFLDELSHALDHNLDRMLSSSATKTVFTHPRLVFFGLFGYWFPTAAEPAVIARRGEV